MLESPTRFEWIRGIGFAVAMGLPLLLSYFVDKPQTLAFVALGAMFALRLDPRHGTGQQVIAIVGGMSLMIASGTLGVLLVGHRELAIAALVLIAYLAGQPKPEQAYLSLLGKFTAAAMLLAEMGLPATANTALAYFSGSMLALCISLVMARFTCSDPQSWSPAQELRQLMAGDINGPLFGLTLPLTILAATLTGLLLHAQHPAWVGLTVLFVMHVNDASTWKRLRQRIVGTLLGVVIAYLMVLWIPFTFYPPIIITLALFIPTTVRQSYLWFSQLISVLVLLVIDIAMVHKGGDLQLIRWRFFDTLIGCLWVAIALLLLRFGKRWWPARL
ncbi:MAG: FUSC family protein [Shewanella sp.]|nr:FUSC family protein [Shewanella sp.]MCF1430684.1 FUSC family protein [Shewanella sp.]MCF1440016.1 FUSC family protein [Shewanella sp.]MCF1456869.1 FUSC family protein [Shewanella sp.]